MSVNHTSDSPTDQLTDLPTFGLTFKFDDTDDPGSVTIYSEADNDSLTRWISADVDSTVDLRDIE